MTRGSPPLATRVAWYCEDGFVVESQSEVRAVLVKRKRFKLAWAGLVVALVCLPVYAALYPLVYLALPEKRLILAIDADGKVREDTLGLGFPVWLEKATGRA